jgi:type VI secretion system protein VasJ
MLGLGKPKQRFELAAHGKHPAFDDYFNLNTDSPLAKALSAWVENGAKRNGRRTEKIKIHSFRFWVRGIKKDELVLGIIRDSSDRMGRPYPLLILGKGSVRAWRKKWHAIFNVFEPVFRAFEELSASRYENFQEFETRLSRICFPEAGFVQVPPGSQGSRLAECMMAWFSEEKAKGVLRLPIATLLDRFSAWEKINQENESWLFKRKQLLPGAVFQGGLPENPMLTIFARPLRQDDFQDLFDRTVNIC